MKDFVNQIFDFINQIFPASSFLSIYTTRIFFDVDFATTGLSPGGPPSRLRAAWTKATASCLVCSSTDDTLLDTDTPNHLSPNSRSSSPNELMMNCAEAAPDACFCSIAPTAVRCVGSSAASTSSRM